jgi:hypothetical protein
MSSRPLRMNAGLPAMASKNALHAGADTSGSGPPAGARRAGIGGAGEIEQVGPLGVVELQGAAERVEHALRDPGEVPAFEAGVVVDAHSGQQGEFLPAWVGYAPGPPYTGRPACSGAAGRSGSTGSFRSSTL